MFSELKKHMAGLLFIALLSSGIAVHAKTASINELARMAEIGQWQALREAGEARLAAVDENDDEGELYAINYYLGLAAFRLQDHYTAIDYFQTALELKPKDYASIEYLYFSHLYTGNGAAAAVVAGGMHPDQKLRLGIASIKPVAYASMEMAEKSYSTDGVNNLGYGAFEIGSQWYSHTHTRLRYARHSQTYLGQEDENTFAQARLSVQPVAPLGFFVGYTGHEQLLVNSSDSSEEVRNTSYFSLGATARLGRFGARLAGTMASFSETDSASAYDLLAAETGLDIRLADTRLGLAAYLLNLSGGGENTDYAQTEVSISQGLFARRWTLTLASLGGDQADRSIRDGGFQIATFTPNKLLRETFFSISYTPDYKLYLFYYLQHASLEDTVREKLTSNLNGGGLYYAF